MSSLVKSLALFSKCLAHIKVRKLWLLELIPILPRNNGYRNIMSANRRRISILLYKTHFVIFITYIALNLLLFVLQNAYRFDFKSHARNQLLRKFHFKGNYIVRKLDGAQSGCHEICKRRIITND
jgi:hypothetical protein